MKSENLALTLQIQECREGMQRMQEVFSGELRELKETVSKLRQEMSVRPKSKENPVKTTPSSSRKATNINPMKEVIAVTTNNKFEILNRDVAENKQENVAARVPSERMVRQPATRPPVSTVNKEGRKTRRKLTPRVIIGDSMVRHVRRHVKLDADGSKHLSMSGRPLKEILNEVKQQAAHIEEGVLIVQGGGNDLMARSAEDTAKLIVDTMRQVKAGKKDLRVGFVGVLRRPRESLAYELRRRWVNKRVGEELGNLKADLAKIKDVGVSFLDLDEQLPAKLFWPRPSTPERGRTKEIRRKTDGMGTLHREHSEEEDRATDDDSRS